MCGITGIFQNGDVAGIDPETLIPMTEALRHRGPDQMTYFIDGNVGFGFRRLSIIDLENGQQPFFNEERSVAVICNGEIYNYKELRAGLKEKGYCFRTECDIEVLLPLYLEYGIAFLDKLNGQFAIAIADKNKDLLFLARDHVGICPLFYWMSDDTLLFASEIKALLRHPMVGKEVDLTGLDQTLSFPGLVSPVTMFKNIKSIRPGHYLLIKNGRLSEFEFWDLCYPENDHLYESRSESYYAEKLEELLLQSIKYRLNADVPVGFYLSGGLDSSLVGAMMRSVNPGNAYESFSISFPSYDNRDIDESNYQKIVSAHIRSKNNEIPFDWSEISGRMREMIYFSECPLKETYNTCSLALSNAVRQKNVKVILSGEGADELFGGYVGYRFDVHRSLERKDKSLEVMLEDQEREMLWGDPEFFYEKNYYEFSEIKRSLYSGRVNEAYFGFDACRTLGINKERLRNRSSLHKRSYLDFKLRLSDHLISDHCDRTCYANSVEGRYPFLDRDLIEFTRSIPPHLKLNGLVEKYILKKVGAKYLPSCVVERQKQGFVAPGSPYLLRNNIEWVNDLLSYDRIKRQGYFNPDTVERIKKIYSNPNFKLNLPYDSDLLIIVLTFNIFLDVFEITEYPN
jgi:asparagine synthase (glutamine-hydrolysing)